MAKKIIKEPTINPNSPYFKLARRKNALSLLKLLDEYKYNKQTDEQKDN